MSTSRDESSDEQLETMFRAGDEAAFAELYRRYRQPLLRYLTRLCGKGRGPDLAEAQDLFQEAFVRVFTSQGGAKRGLFRVWLYKVATNEYRGLLRKKAVRRQVRFVGEPDTQPAPANPAEPSAADHPSDQEIRDAVQSLPPLQRTAVVLSCFQGLSYAQIAEVEDCSTGAIKSRMFVARKMLRERLGS